MAEYNKKMSITGLPTIACTEASFWATNQLIIRTDNFVAIMLQVTLVVIFIISAPLLWTSFYLS